MESIREIYRIGHGPSSSHTMGPRFAAERFNNENPSAISFRVSLYGSLAATGKGHLTDVAIAESLQPKTVEFNWFPEIVLPFHPNGMKFEALDAQGKVMKDWLVYSVGGGKITDENSLGEEKKIYEHSTIGEIMPWVERRGQMYWEYVNEREDSDIWDYLNEVWKTMQNAIHEGLETDGVLPGELGLRRKAASYWIKAKGYKQSLQSRCLVMAYAMAVSEQNASGGTVVTAPTCGSSGVMPAILYHFKLNHSMSDRHILQALATAGLFGNIIKKNASISGAEVGCQGEVGSACAMAAAGLTDVLGGTPSQCANAAEIGIEHHLGMTCDPIAGLVQVPCIERNAMAAVKAINASRLALKGNGQHVVSLDKAIKTMKETGMDMMSKYKETALGGLATNVLDQEQPPHLIPTLDVTVNYSQC